MSKPAKTKRACSGCHNDFYNGNNELGVKECWSFAEAKMVKRRRVYMDERPPWNRDPEWMLNCRTERGAILVDPKVTR